MYENKKIGFLFVLPFVLGVIGFKLFPFVMSLALSFTQYDIINPPEFIGLDNYKELAAHDGSSSFRVELDNENPS